MNTNLIQNLRIYRQYNNLHLLNPLHFSQNAEPYNIYQLQKDEVSHDIRSLLAK